MRTVQNTLTFHQPRSANYCLRQKPTLAPTLAISRTFDSDHPFGQSTTGHATSIILLSTVKNFHRMLLIPKFRRLCDFSPLWALYNSIQIRHPSQNSTKFPNPELQSSSKHFYTLPTKEKSQNPLPPLLSHLIKFSISALKIIALREGSPSFPLTLHLLTFHRHSLPFHPPETIFPSLSHAPPS